MKQIPYYETMWGRLRVPPMAADPGLDPDPDLADPIISRFWIQAGINKNSSILDLNIEFLLYRGFPGSREPEVK